jgi:signal transduction histidine kinase
MQEGGRLTLTTIPTEDGGVSISIQDTGCGMSPEQQQRIFEPFFTTKDKGVGLGMSVVHRIIEAHHGTIKIESEEGKGTTFIIMLPFSEQ